MGIYAEEFDDTAVEAKAVELCIADGGNPYVIMWLGGEPVGPIWTNYIHDAIEALGST